MKKRHGIYVALLCMVIGLSSVYGFDPSDMSHGASSKKKPPKSLLSTVPHDEESVVEVVITYEPVATPLISYENLQLRWCFLFVEQLAKTRLKQSMNESCSYYDIYTTGKKLSASLVSIEFSCREQDLPAAMGHFFKEINDLQNEKFTEEEFEEHKEECLRDIGSLINSNSDHQSHTCFPGIREDYESLNCTYVSYEEFLELSYGIVRTLTVDDIQGLVADYFSEERRQVDYILSQHITGPTDEEEDAVSFMRILAPSFEESNRGFATLKKGLSNGDVSTYSTGLFHGLSLSEMDKKLIRKIVTTTADKNVFQLLLDKKSLERKGKKIRPVHPLRFLGFICSEPQLRSSLRSISKNHFKWSSFVEGFADRMKEESKRGQLLPYVPGFADMLHVDPNTVANYINRSDYEGLMKFFI